MVVHRRDIGLVAGLLCGFRNLFYVVLRKSPISVLAALLTIRVESVFLAIVRVALLGTP